MFWKASQNSQINTRSSYLELFYQKMFLKILQNSQKIIFAGVSFLIKLQAGNLNLSEVATGDVLGNKVALKMSQISQEKTCAGVSYATLSKNTLTQVLSCEICKLFKNNYFEEHLWTSTSNPANICWSWRRLEDVFNTSSV